MAKIHDAIEDTKQEQQFLQLKNHVLTENFCKKLICKLYEMI